MSKIDGLMHGLELALLNATPAGDRVSRDVE